MQRNCDFHHQMLLSWELTFSFWWTPVIISTVCWHLSVTIEVSAIPKISSLSQCLSLHRVWGVYGLQYCIYHTLYLILIYQNFNNTADHPNSSPKFTLGRSTRIIKKYPLSIRHVTILVAEPQICPHNNLLLPNLFLLALSSVHVRLNYYYHVLPCRELSKTQLWQC